MPKHALIVGVGAGLSASLARKLRAEGYEISLASRSETKFASIARETNAKTFLCDASQIDDVAKLIHRSRYGRAHARSSSATTPLGAHADRSPNSIPRKC